MTLPPLPPLPMQLGLPPLPIPSLPPLPPRIYSQGRQVTAWFPMRVLPCADRKGEYEVRFDNAPDDMAYWDGKRWPTLQGNFHVTGWRGVAVPPAGGADAPAA